ncbi:MAG: type II secretion system protein [Candidatus Omnitrophica bacterium]|nr:type II secretion system protein [Candidatus Omnitrophota bacterium]
MKKTSSKVGFTLIELLLVTGILAVVGMVVYGTFVRGITIWRRVSQPASTEDVGLFFKNISYDLRNSFKMSGLKFRGGKREISFSTRIRHHDRGETEDSIGQVTYSFDRRKNKLHKSQANYSEIYRKKSGRKRVLAEDISSLQFEYFAYNAERKKYSWVTSWQERDEPFGEEVKENLPLIVKIEVGIPKGEFKQKFVKTVSIPSACCWPFADEEEK